MTLSAGSRLGPYEILAPIGAGGMGEVYRARDTRLGREVAVKVLPASLSSDPDRLKRFEKEGRAASSLNHPNIVTIHDIGESGGTSFIAMEIVAGQTLRDLLAEGGLTTKRLLPIAAQVVDGLAKAHVAGIVHRDLKPENVMVTKDGLVKILDFGLAKLTQPEDVNGTTHAPTVSRGTSAGIVMGTVRYMSPEQAMGKPLDFRSDQFSFGSILYEMATGRRAFARDSVPETLTAIIRDEPEPMGKLSPLSPAPLRWIVERCLAKNPDGRYASTRDLAHDLGTLKDRLAEVGGGAAPGRSFAASPRWLIGLAAAGLVAAAAFAALYALRRPSGPAASSVRFVVRAPEGTKFTWLRTQNLFAVSPDGRRIAFVTRGADGRDSLWVRPLVELAAAPLAGTEGAAAPFWSPDSRFIGFFADGKLKKIDSLAGPPVTLCDVTSATPSGSWGSQHKILFAGHAEPSVSLVEDSGGAPREAVKVDPSRHERSVGWPSFLPDGRHFLYVGRGKEEPHTYVRMANLEDGKTTPLLTNCSRAQYVPGDPNAPAGNRSGHLLYARDGSLLAQPFDSDRLRLAGDAIPAGQEIWQHVFIGTGPFSASDNGVLASRGRAGETRLAWIDRAGREAGSLASPAGFEWVRLSRDSRKVVVGRVDPRTGAHDLWVGELPREVLTRLNLGSEDYLAPTWSPDGTRIALSVGSSSRGPNLSWLALHGSVSPEPIIPAGAANQRPTDWSWDGRFLLYTLRSASDAGVWVVNLEGERKSRKLLSVSGEATNQTQAQFSPDGRWIAYCFPESDRSEVYLTSFPEPGERVRVSASGGSRPRWKGDGRELYYVSAGNEMIATPVRLGSSVQVGAPRPLFRMSPAGWRDYDVTADGERFLVIENLPAPDADAIAVTTNWSSLLRR